MYYHYLYALSQIANYNIFFNLIFNCRNFIYFYFIYDYEKWHELHTAILMLQPMVIICRILRFLAKIIEILWWLWPDACTNGDHFTVNYFFRITFWKDRDIGVLNTNCSTVNMHQFQHCSTVIYAQFSLLLYYHCGMWYTIFQRYKKAIFQDKCEYFYYLWYNYTHDSHVSEYILIC